MIRFVLTFLVVSMSFLSFSQKKRDSVKLDKHEHHVFVEGGGTALFYSFGYNYKYRPCSWLKIGMGMGQSITPEKKPFTNLVLQPHAFVNLGYNWFFAELGFEFAPIMNFYAIHDQDKYFNCPNGICEPKVEFWYSPYIGGSFVIKERNEIVLTYKPLVYYGGSGYTEHWLGVKYRFQFL